MGKLIIAGFTRAAMESKVLPDVGEHPRSRSGTQNVFEVAKACLQAPEAAGDLGEALAKNCRLDQLYTKDLMSLVMGGEDKGTGDRYIGLYPALEKLPLQQKQRLTDILFDLFLPELILRHQADSRVPGDGNDFDRGRLIDMIVDLTSLKQGAGWQAIGKPLPAERVWRYYSFDPLTEKDKLVPGTGKRLREVALPPGMDKWYSPEFDDSKWQSGRAPIGGGVFKAHGPAAPDSTQTRSSTPLGRWTSFSKASRKRISASPDSSDPVFVVGTGWQEERLLRYGL